MAMHDALAKVRSAAELLRAKRELLSTMPAIQRLRSVARINDLHQELRTGRPAVPSSPHDQKQGAQ